MCKPLPVFFLSTSSSPDALQVPPSKVSQTHLPLFPAGPSHHYSSATPTRSPSFLCSGSQESPLGSPLLQTNGFSCWKEIQTPSWNWKVSLHLLSAPPADAVLCTKCSGHNILSVPSMNPRAVASAVPSAPNGLAPGVHG